jgi:hypothetical protein
VIAAALALAVAASSPPISDDVAHAAFVFLEAQRSHARGARCFQVDGHDPSAALAERLRAELRDWVPGSECFEEEFGERRVRVRTRDGEPAEFLSLSGMKAENDRTYSVDYAFWAGTFTGAGSTLRVEFHDGRWRVSRPSQYEWVE